MAEQTRLESKTTIKFWPSPQDYNESVQSPEACFADKELQGGIAEADTLGLPRPVTGAFASVYKLKCGKRAYAVRCFLHNVNDQRERYEMISRYVMNDDLPYTVTFEFQERGIKVNGEWFPILKMEWVDGLTLDQYIEKKLGNKFELARLKNSFVEMCEDLEKAGIAHGDLQHGNIMVLRGGQLRLVDYDGMFVPEMVGMKSNELGHRNYQHPARKAQHFGPSLDNISAWIIFVSLAGLTESSDIRGMIKAGSDCLLLKQQDLVDPERSEIFQLLENHRNSDLRTYANSLRWLLESKPMTSLKLGSVSPGAARSKVKPPIQAQTSSVQQSVPRPTEIELGDDWCGTFLKTMGWRRVEAIEPELLLPVPRKVSNDGKDYKVDTTEVAILVGVSCLILSIIAPLIFGMFLKGVQEMAVILGFFGIAFCFMQNNEQRIVSRGVAVPGRIERSWSKRVVVDGITETREELYFVEVAYPCRFDEVVGWRRETVKVTAGQWCRLADGSQTTVVYMPNSPEDFVIYQLSKWKACK